MTFLSFLKKYVLPLSITAITSYAAVIFTAYLLHTLSGNVIQRGPEYKLVIYTWGLLPTLYIAAKHWISKEWDHFFLPVLIFAGLNALIQTSVDMTSQISAFTNMPPKLLAALVWASMISILLTTGRHSFNTYEQCKKHLYWVWPMALLTLAYNKLVPLIGTAYFAVPGALITLIPMPFIVMTFLYVRMRKTSSVNVTL